MGVDIHLHIIDTNGNMIAENIFEGQNSEWFRQLQNKDYKIDFPCCPGIPEIIPEEIKKDYENMDYYGYNYIPINEYIEWFEENRPDKDAGWVTTYEKYLYENKKIIPNIDKKCLYSEDIVADYHFVEVVDEYNNFYWLYRKIFELCPIYTISELRDFIIIYYFDC